MVTAKGLRQASWGFTALALVDFAFEPVDELGEGVEADDVGAVGYEIAQRIDVVVVALGWFAFIKA